MAPFDLPRKGVTHVECGIGAIAHQLVDAIKRYDGQIHNRQEVVRLVMQQGRAVAAHTNQDRAPPGVTVGALRVVDDVAAAIAARR